MKYSKIGNSAIPGNLGTTITGALAGLGQGVQWTPQIYDHETFKTSCSGWYWKCGILGFAYFILRSSTMTENITFSTALFVRNVPFSNVQGGGIFIPGDFKDLSGNVDARQGGNLSVQGSDSSTILFRPNLTGTLNKNSGQSLTGWCWGVFTS